MHRSIGYSEDYHIFNKFQYCSNDGDIIIRVEDGEFLISGDQAFSITRKKKKINKNQYEWQEKRSCIGPGVRILARVLDGGKKGYLVRVGKEIIFMKSIFDFEELQERTGIAIVSPQVFKKFLNAQLRVRKDEIKNIYLASKTLFSESDWDYYHPAMGQDDIIYKIDIKGIDFKCYNTNKNLEFLYELLKEGKLAGVAALASISALLPTLLGYTVYITGAKGIGKTTLARAVCRFWANWSDRTFTMYGTQNALELSLSKLNNMSILLDEASLTIDDKLESFIFMVASGQGKSRANKQLKVKVNKLCSVVFITSETEFEAKTQGVYRRLLPLHISDWQEVTDMDINAFRYKANEGCGAGIEIAKFLIQQGREFLSEIENQAEAEVGSSVLVWEREIYKALLLLESYFSEEFAELRKTIKSITKEHKNEVQKTVWETIQDNLRNFYYTYKSHFVEDDEQKIYREVWGETIWSCKEDIEKYFKDITEVPSKFLLLNKDGMDEFCGYVKLTRRTVIKEAQKQGRLVTNEEGRNTFRYTDGVRFYLIAVPLRDVFKDWGITDSSILTENERKLLIDVFRLSKNMRIKVKIGDFIEKEIRDFFKAKWKELKEINALEDVLLEISLKTAQAKTAGENSVSISYEDIAKIIEKKVKK